MLRNTCAHGGVLFDFMTPKGIALLPSIGFNGNNIDIHWIQPSKIITFVLKSISNDRKNDLENDLNTLF